MPELTRPWALLLLGLIPPAVLGWVSRRRPALRFSDVRLFPTRSGGSGRSVRLAAGIARGVALTLLVAAISGPRWPDRQTRLPAEGISIEMVLDVSGSMNEADFAWPGEGPVKRLDAAKRAFRLFVAGTTGPTGPEDISLPGRPDDVIGLITFDDRPHGRCPLTLSHDVLLRILDAEQAHAETTDIGDAVAWGLDRLRHAPTRKRALVLLTDGYQNTAGNQALSTHNAAVLAAGLGVPVYAIDAGRESDREGESPEDRKKAVTALRELAETTGGAYLPASDGAGLLDAYRRIDRLARDDVTPDRYRRFYDASPWLGLAALAVFAAVGALEATRWQVLP